MLPEPIDAGQRLLAHLVDLAPVAGSVLLLLAAGLVASWLARRLVVLLVRRTGLEAIAETVGLVRVLYALQIQSSLTEVLARLSVIAIWLTVAMSMADVVGLPGIAEGFAAVVEFLPKVLTATVIMAVGLAGADLARRVMEGIGKKRPELAAPGLLASGAYYTVIAVFASTAVQHVGIQTVILDQLLLLLVGVAAGTLGLSMALGARKVVDNAVARHYGQQLARPGDGVTVGDLQGIVIRYDALTVTIRDNHGNDHVLPCAVLLSDAGFQLDRVPETDDQSGTL
jgi:hypothetical protein